jgi:hypothetical protein
LAGGDCGLNKSRALRLSFGRSQVYVTTPYQVFDAGELLFNGPIDGWFSIYHQTGP